MDGTGLACPDRYRYQRKADSKITWSRVEEEILFHFVAVWNRKHTQ
jgi:hypothetical protein